MDSRGTSSVGVFALAATSVAIGVGYLGYHKHTTGEAIQRLVPEWEVASVAIDDVSLPPPSEGPYCASAIDTANECVFIPAGAGAAGGYAIGRGSCTLVNMGDTQAAYCEIPGWVGGAVGGAGGAAVGTLRCAGGAVIRAAGSAAQWTADRIQGAWERMFPPKIPPAADDQQEGVPTTGPTQKPPVLRGSQRMESKVKVRNCQGKTQDFNGWSGMDRVLNCSRNLEEAVLGKGIFHDLFEKVIQDALARREGLSQAARQCLENKKQSMLNCAEKDVFDRMLETCGVTTEEELDELLCSIDSWKAFWDGNRGAVIDPCPQCCVFFETLWSRVANKSRKQCPGKDALAQNRNSQQCKKIRDKNYHGMCGPVAQRDGRGGACREGPSDVASNPQQPHGAPAPEVIVSSSPPDAP